MSGSLDLEGTPQRSTIYGNCEYRKAVDFGYGYNFLISYGENHGTVMQIKVTGIPGDGLTFYKHPAGGAATVVYGNITEHIDTYAETPELTSISLTPLWVTSIFDVVLPAAEVVLLSFVIYRIATILQNSDKSKEKKLVCGEHSSSIDVVRTAAAFLVVFVHSFLAIDYYQTPLNDSVMIGMTMVRWFALICVPLFMIITGYLCIYRTGILQNWLGSLPIWILYAMITAIVDIVWNGYMHRDVFSVMGVVTDIVGCRYAWYVEMYAGLIILMPFLNKMWKALGDNEKNVLIAAMLLLTAMNTLGIDILPSYFLRLYPVTYYFIGAYLREKPITLGTGKLILALVATLALETIYMVTQTKGGVFDWSVLGGAECHYNVFIVVVSAVLGFTLLNRIHLKNRFVKKLFQIMGKNTLGIYLISSGLTDNIMWPHLQQRFTSPHQYIGIVIPVVVADFLISFFAAAILNIIAVKVSMSIKMMLSFNKKEQA